MELTNHPLQLCHEYLINLQKFNKPVTKLRLDFFENLIKSDQPVPTNILSSCLEILSELYENCNYQFVISCDISYAFCIIVFVHSDHTVNVLIEMLTSKPSTSQFNHFNGFFLLHKENAELLSLGILTFFVRHCWKFETENYNLIHSKTKKLISSLLSRNEMNLLLSVADTWLRLITLQDQLPVETYSDTFKVLFTIVLLRWNHHITEFRRRISDLLLKCLNLNYENAAKLLPQRDKLFVIVQMETFRGIAYEMFWSVPFKYFAYTIGLKFVSEIYPISKFIKAVRSDLHEGFLSSLRNKRIIGVETDLFKFCTDKLQFEDWEEVFQPLIHSVISSDNTIIAHNFARLWLPVIAKKFPEYPQKIFNLLPSKRFERTLVHSRILFALLRTCYQRKILLPPMTDEIQFLTYLEGLFLESEEIRGELFALLCSLHDQSVLHTEPELRIILKFLKLNVLSSCPILRQYIFSSFARFVLRLICSCVKAIKTESDINFKLHHVLIFLKDLNEFFIEGIEPSCSYQRKVTCLTLYKTFMTYAVFDCGSEIRRNNLKDVEKFSNFVKRQGFWNFENKQNCIFLIRCLMDPCEEIQRLSFVLLRTYFDLSAVDNHETIYLYALEMLKDNQFYKRNNGVSAVLSFIALFYNSKMQYEIDILKDYSTFTEMFLHLLENQAEILSEDILNSALYHPLDGTIKVLTFLVANVTSPEYDTVSEVHIERLISILETIVPLLLQALFIDNSSDYAPSFEESDKALHSIIQKSSTLGKLKISISKDHEYQLQPVHQILLNFIWISLKVCCEFESSLILNRTQSLSEAQVIRCSDLVIKKLKLCRHKGVIEAAAIALSNIVESLTSRDICEKWLDSILMDIIHLIQYKSGAAVSRKSAGLSLLIQNIVANDKRPQKPLLRTCWLEFRRILDVNFNSINFSIAEELPQAHVLHFLKEIIADVRNTAELSAYLEEITIVCLKTLKAPIWTVRNAALQLFGALVPKMVGQKNSQNDFGVRRSFEEVFFCMPALLDYIVSTFETSTTEPTSRKLISHSDLVPLLIVLSNIQVGSVNLMQSPLHSKLARLRRCTQLLLGSEVYFVREFASKTFVSLHSAEETTIYEKLMDDVVRYLLNGERNSIVNENHLHGYLLVLKRAFVQYSNLKPIRYGIHCRIGFAESGVSAISFISAALLYQLKIYNLTCNSWEEIFKHVTCVVNELQRKKYRMFGFDEWTYTLIEIVVKHCDESSFEKLCALCLDTTHSCIIQNFLKILPCRRKLLEEKNEFVRNLLLQFLQKYSRLADTKSSVLNCILKTFVSLPPSENQHYVENFEFLINLNYYTYRALNLRALCSLVTSSTSEYLINVLLREIRKTSDMARFKKDIRLNSAESMLCLSNKLPATSLKLVWLTVIDIVQDEEVEIRQIGCKCYEKMIGISESYFGPETVLEEILDENQMKKYLSINEVMEILWKTLCTTCFEIQIQDTISNPFDQGIVYFYKEEVKMVSLCGKAIIRLCRSNQFLNEDVSVKNLEKYYSLFITKILGIVPAILENAALISAPSYTLILRCHYLLSILITLSEVGVYSSEGTSLQLNGTTVDFNEIEFYSKEIREVFDFKFK